MKLSILSGLLAAILVACNLTTQSVAIPAATPPPTRTTAFEDSQLTPTVPSSATEATPVESSGVDGNSTAECKPHTEWEEYTIQAGDNLTRVATRTRSTVDELIAANCLDDPNRIRVGQTIYVPNAPES